MIQGKGPATLVQDGDDATLPHADASAGQDGEAGRSPGNQGIVAWVAELDRRLLLAALLASLVLADLVASFVWPYAKYVMVTSPAWQADYETCRAALAPGEGGCLPPIPDHLVRDGIWHEYLLDSRMTLTGAYLVLLPAMWLTDSGLLWFPWQPFIWFGAVGSGAGAAWLGRRLPRWQQTLFAFSIGLVASGFGAYHWSTAGD